VRRVPPRTSGVGSFLLVLGFLTILAIAFGAGVGAGRRWPRLLPSLGGAAMVKADRQDGERGPGRLPIMRNGPGAAPGERSSPELTFYSELTAPLTAPPPASKPRPERGERSAKPETKPESKPETRPEMPKREALRAEPAASEQRFTVQVGAYKTREQAQAVQSRLAGAGYDAYIVDFDGPPGTRFRVRVGSFTSRDEARPIAERLASERKSPTYVTTR
jgi:cell division protein FtsN